MKTIFVLSNGNNSIVCTKANDVRSHMTGPDGKLPTLKTITEVCRQLKAKEIDHYALYGWNITTSEVEDARPRKTATVKIETKWKKMTAKNIKMLAELHALVVESQKPDPKVFVELYEKLRGRCDVTDNDLSYVRTLDLDGIRKEMKQARESLRKEKDAPISLSDLQSDDVDEEFENSDEEREDTLKRSISAIKSGTRIK